MTTDTTSQEFFDSKYRRQSDPWDFASNSYELARYDAIYRALCHRTYETAFEPGCSIGVLTARLAPLCSQLRAYDISPTATASAGERCRALPQVTVACGALPGCIPSERLDLIVLSEIGYYFHFTELHQLGTILVSRLKRNGVLLAAHWLGESQDHLLTGDAVHGTIGALDGLTREHGERHPGFRIDRWVRT